jgi:hypothetical protein
MVAQMKAPARRLEMLMQPSAPPRDGHVTYGFRHDKQGNWTLTGYGQDAAAVAQRILMRYALHYETRSELARRYGFSERNVQDIISGNRSHWYTDPIRARLLANGVGNPRMNRSAKGGRVIEVKQALERLAARAHDMVIWPERFSWDQKSDVATDLFLLSGAWREDEHE